MNSWLFLISVCMLCAIAKSVPGGWTPETDLDSPLIQKHSKKAVALVSKDMNSEQVFKLVKVTKVDSQVVAGKNYKIDMVMGSTECKKSENLTEEQIEDCPLQKCGETQHCIVTMWVKAWQNFHEITDSSCEPVESSC